MDKFIDFVVRQRLLVILFALVVAGCGFLALRRLPIDAFPDVTPVLVQIFTEAEGLAPEEVEKLITYPTNLPKPKRGLCVCFDGGNFEHKLGVMVRRDTSPPYIEVACVVVQYSSEGDLSGGGDCTDWTVIAK